MIGGRMANVIKRFARHRDDMRLANFQPVRVLDAEQEQACALLVEAVGEAKDSKVAMLVAVRTRALALRLRD